ncbi:MAG: Hint domain-containing protein [Paracoccaceae bacterium]
MAIEAIVIYGGLSLRNSAGNSAIDRTDTDGNLVGNPPYTMGAGAPVITTINDTGNINPGSGSTANFEDGTGIAQFTTQPITLAYQGAGGPTTQTFAQGTRIQAEFEITFSSGYRIIGIRLGTGTLVTAGFVVIPPPGGDATPPPGFNFGTASPAITQPSVPWAQIPCFVAGTRIATPRGLQAVETLRAGHTVTGQGGQALRVIWAGSVDLDLAETVFRSDLWPVVFPAGVLGNALPLRLSPQHRVVLRHPVAELVTGEPEVLAAATMLVGLSGVERRRPTGRVTYVHFLVEGHALVSAEGAEVETLLLTDAVRDGLVARMGDKNPLPQRPNAEPALLLAKRQEARVIFARIAVDVTAQPRTGTAG